MPSEVEQLIERAEEAIAARLGAHGVEHSRAAARTAAEIADAYGADRGEAFLAGLLHDWAKDLTDEELLGEAGRLGVPVTGVDRDVPYLLHAAVGAGLLAEEMPDVPAEVLRAVARHTLGAPGMSALEMVVFVADMLEPSRRFDGVAGLRASVGEVSLQDLYMAAYARSLTHVIETGRHLHPATVPAWNAAVAAVEGREGR